jgi:hypothetical protein
MWAYSDGDINVKTEPKIRLAKRILIHAVSYLGLNNLLIRWINRATHLSRLKAFVLIMKKPILRILLLSHLIMKSGSVSEDSEMQPLNNI